MLRFENENLLLADRLDLLEAENRRLRKLLRRRKTFVNDTSDDYVDLPSLV